MGKIIFIIIISPIYFLFQILNAFELLIFGEIKGSFTIFIPPENDNYLWVILGLTLWFGILYLFYKFFIKKLAKFIEVYMNKNKKD